MEDVEEDEADEIVDAASDADGRVDGVEKVVRSSCDADGYEDGESGASDDEGLLASVFDQPATERASRRLWVIAAARRAVARRAIHHRAHDSAGSDGAESDDGETACGDRTVVEPAEGGLDAASGEHEADDAIGCGPEALPAGVERIDLERHFHTDQGSGEGASAKAYRDADGNPVLLCKMHHYAWRANELECFNALEFTSLFDIRAMTKQDRVWYRARARRIRYQGAWFYCFLLGLLKGVREKRRAVAALPHGQASSPGPLTLANAVGRRVLVPSSFRRDWHCDQHREEDKEGRPTSSRGKGWEADVVDGHDVRAGYLRVQFKFILDDAAKYRRWKQEPVEVDIKMSVLHPLSPPPILEHVTLPTALEPLTLENAPGRHVLVPSSLWPDVECGERGGDGWEAVVKSTFYARNGAGEKVEAARVDFCFARHEKNGRRFRSVPLELAQLCPLRTPPSAARGRPTYRYVLREPHPLASNYIIFRRSKWGVPALAGRPPPSLPSVPTGRAPTLSVGLRARRKKEAAFARYFVSNLVPWSAWNKPALTLENWRTHVEELEEDARLSDEKHELEKAGDACRPPFSREPGAPDPFSRDPGPDDEQRLPPLGFREARRKRLIAASRLADIENLVQGFKAPKLASVLLDEQLEACRPQSSGP